jgi:peroxiredoxin
MGKRMGTLLLLFCACLAGQPAAQETRDLIATRSSDAGTVTIHLRNQYSSPATAWILQCQVPGGGSRHYWDDQDLSFQTTPIDPGKEIEFQIRPRPAGGRMPQVNNGTCEDFRPIVAIFADGTVSGDLRWINAIIAERRQAYQDIAKATEILSAAISKGTETPTVIQQLTDWQKSTRLNGMAGRPSATFGPSSGWQSRGTAPPPPRPMGSPVPGAALWLVETQKKALPDAVQALGEWHDRLANLPAVMETGEPSPRPIDRVVGGAPFTPPSETEMLGRAAPEFTLKDVDGRDFTLASLRGKPVLLDFWATWCEPCREEMPHIKALYDQFKDKGLMVVCVDTNEPAEKARKYFEDNHYSFISLVEGASNISKQYGAGGIPRVVLIDKDGIVRYFHRGWGPGMDLGPEVKKLVE